VSPTHLCNYSRRRRRRICANFIGDDKLTARIDSCSASVSLALRRRPEWIYGDLQLPCCVHLSGINIDRRRLYRVEAISFSCLQRTTAIFHSGSLLWSKFYVNLRHNTIDECLPCSLLFKFDEDDSIRYNKRV